MNSTHRLAAVARRLGWGRNALRRPSDRIESAVLAAAVALTIAATPLAMAFGSAAYHYNMAVSAEQTAASYQVTATLQEPTDSTVILESVATTVLAKAEWTAPDGSEHTGLVSAPQEAPAGTAVHVWTNRRGDAIGAPLSTTQAWGRGVMVGILTMVAAATLCTALACAFRWRLNRIRYAAWEAEWRQIDPWRTPHSS